MKPASLLLSGGDRQLAGTTTELESTSRGLAHSVLAAGETNVMRSAETHDSAVNRQQADEQLAILCAQGGSREAFSRLVDIYELRLLYFIRRILGDSDGALDVLQSVWLTVHRRLGRLRAPEAFRVWLYRIAHDEAVSELRRMIRRPLLVDDVQAFDPPGDVRFDEPMFDNAELVHVALRDLPVDQRRLLTLRFLEEMTIDEIAEVVGCLPGTVKSRLYYAKGALRTRLEELANE